MRVIVHFLCMTEAAPRRDVRLSVEMAERVDRWRGAQPGIPSRTKAVAQLLDAALTLVDRYPPDGRERARAKE
jgi:hypothetical protein